MLVHWQRQSENSRIFAHFQLVWLGHHQHTGQPIQIIIELVSAISSSFFTSR